MSLLRHCYSPAGRFLPHRTTAGEQSLMISLCRSGMSFRTDLVWPQWKTKMNEPNTETDLHLIFVTAGASWLSFLTRLLTPLVPVVSLPKAETKFKNKLTERRFSLGHVSVVRLSLPECHRSPVQAACYDWQLHFIAKLGSYTSSFTVGKLISRWILFTGEINQKV